MSQLITTNQGTCLKRFLRLARLEDAILDTAGLMYPSIPTYVGHIDDMFSFFSDVCLPKYVLCMLRLNIKLHTVQMLRNPSGSK